MGLLELRNWIFAEWIDLWAKPAFLRSFLLQMVDFLLWSSKFEMFNSESRIDTEN